MHIKAGSMWESVGVSLWTTHKYSAFSSLRWKAASLHLHASFWAPVQSLGGWSGLSGVSLCAYMPPSSQTHFHHWRHEESERQRLDVGQIVDDAVFVTVSFVLCFNVAAVHLYQEVRFARRPCSYDDCLASNSVVCDSNLPVLVYVWTDCWPVQTAILKSLLYSMSPFSTSCQTYPALEDSLI